MLLSVEPRNLKNVGTYLDTWYVGGEHLPVARPFNPYLFSNRYIAGHKNTTQRMIDLATWEQLTMYKVEFDDTYALKKFSDPAFTTDDDIPFVQRIVIDEGIYCPSSIPRHAAFDIETWKGDIRAIAYYGHDLKGKQIGGYSAGADAREHLEFLNESLQATDPDLLDSYWGSYFDVTNTEKAARQLGVELNWGRGNNKRPYIKQRSYRRGPKEGFENLVRLEGRLHFDVWKEVDLDQTLPGIKDKRLRTVAEWFHLPSCAKIDYEHMDEMSDDDLGECCLTHAKATFLLADIYLNRLYYFCDSLGIPLNMILERTPSHIPNYRYMRDLQKLGFISREANFERYPQFFKFGRKGYQGAVIKLYNAGIYFDNLWKLDWKSMYPTIMAVFNLSPDTVRLAGIQHMPCTGLEAPKFAVVNGKQQITFFDDRVGAVTIEIDDHDGVTRQYIKEWMGKRAEVKAALHDNPHDPILESEQWGLKVNLNSLYGYHGMRYARYGCAPIAAATTAFGRWWLNMGVDLIRQYSNLPIESDTDGIYTQGGNLAKEIEEAVKAVIPEPYDTSFIHIDADAYQSGIFYEEKSYLLKELDGKILFHGSGLKGRNMPPLFDKALMEMAETLLNEGDPEPVLWKYGLRMEQFDLGEFVMVFELHKGKFEYVNQSMYAELIEKARKHGMEVEQGSEIRYIKVKDGYMPYPLKGVDYNVDYAYYRERLTKVLARILGPTKRMGHKVLERIVTRNEKGLSDYDHY